MSKYINSSIFFIANFEVMTPCQSAIRHKRQLELDFSGFQRFRPHHAVDEVVGFPVEFQQLRESEPHRMMKTKRWLTASQAASELGISTRTLDVLVNQGRIGTLVVPGLITRRFSADDVRTLVEAGTRPATNPAVRRESELVRA